MNSRFVVVLSVILNLAECCLRTIPAEPGIVVVTTTTTIAPTTTTIAPSCNTCEFSDLKLYKDTSQVAASSYVYTESDGCRGITLTCSPGGGATCSGNIQAYIVGTGSNTIPLGTPGPTETTMDLTCNSNGKWWSGSSQVALYFCYENNCS